MYSNVFCNPFNMLLTEVYVRTAVVAIHLVIYFILTNSQQSTPTMVGQWTIRMQRKCCCTIIYLSIKLYYCKQINQPILDRDQPSLMGSRIVPVEVPLIQSNHLFLHMKTHFNLHKFIIIIVRLLNPMTGRQGIFLMYRLQVDGFVLRDSLVQHLKHIVYLQRFSNYLICNEAYLEIP